MDGLSSAINVTWTIFLCLTEFNKNILQAGFFFHIPLFLSFTPPELGSLCSFGFTVNISMYHCHISPFSSYRGASFLQCTIHPHSPSHAEHGVHANTWTEAHMVPMSACSAQANTSTCTHTRLKPIVLKPV